MADFGGNNVGFKIFFSSNPIVWGTYHIKGLEKRMPATLNTAGDRKDPYEELAPHYDKAIGSLDQRSDQYKSFFANILKQYGCRYVLDVSCGTGVDSAILLEHGFKVVSTDASPRMLEFARKLKAERAGDPRYDDWIIQQAFWQTLPEDLSNFLPPGTRFDAVVCLANSIAHVLDDDGAHSSLRRCLRNLATVVKPGGVLLVDHRNYDAMLDNVQPSTHNVYYKYQNPIEIKSTLITEGGVPNAVFIDFYVDILGETNNIEKRKLRLSCYPHRLSSFSSLLSEAFSCRCTPHVFADFKPLGQVPVPEFYLHVVHKHDLSAY